MSSPVTGSQVDSVQDWLEQLGLGQYALAFAENAVDLDVLPDLTTDDLKELGVNAIGHRRKILSAAVKLLRVQRAESAVQPIEDDTPVASSVERRVLTVLFVDLVGSTALSSRSDPEDYRDFIEQFRTTVSAAVEAYRGTIAQFLGDGVMVTFGYPLATGHDAERAVAAGLAASQAIAKMPAFTGSQPIARVGIATGLSVVGTLIGGGLTDTSAIGDTANLAARLQDAAYPGQVVISEATRRIVGDQFECVNLGSYTIKGFSAPQHVWRVDGRSTAESRYKSLMRQAAPTPFVGREKEVAQLRRARKAAHAGFGAVSLIVGETGIGKSRLVHEALDDPLNNQELAVQTSGLRQPIRVLQCSPVRSQAAFFPIAYLLEKTLGIQVDEGPQRTALRLSAWLDTFGLDSEMNVALLSKVLNIDTGLKAPLASLNPAQQRARQVELLTLLLKQLTTPHGCILIEDAQFVDPSTAELLQALIPVLNAETTQVVITTRDRKQPRWLDSCRIERINLRRMRPSEIALLVSKLTNIENLPPHITVTIAERSDGIPFFIKELSRAYTASLAADASAGQVPLSLSESLVGRLDQLINGRKIASLAAAIGREFPVSVLEALSDLPEDVVTAGITELIRAEILQPSQSRYGNVVRFTNNLDREAAYETLLKRSRHDLHRRIAKVLVQQFPDIVRDNAQILAHQLNSAGEFEQACEHWQIAAQGAFGRGAYAEASASYRRGLEALLNCPETRERDELELDLRTSVISTEKCLSGFKAPDSDEQQTAVIRLSERLGDSASYLHAVHVKWGQLLTGDCIRASREVALLCRDSFEASTDEERLLILRMCATSFLFSGQLEEALAHYFRFMDIFDPKQHSEAMRASHLDHGAIVMLGIGEAYTLMGKQDEAEAWATRAIEHAEAGGRSYDVLHILVFGGCLHPYLNGNFDLLEDSLVKLEQLVAAENAPNWEGFPKLFRGLLDYRRGNRVEGRLLARQGIEALLSIKAYGDWWLLLFAELCLHARDFERAGDALTGAESALADGETRFAAEYHRLRGLLQFMRDGASKDASAQVDEAVEIAARQCAGLFERRARLPLSDQLADWGEWRDNPSNVIELSQPA